MAYAGQGKLPSAFTIDEFETTAKTIPGAVNELKGSITPEIIHNANFASTGSSYTYKSLPALSEYAAVLMMCVAGEDSHPLVFAPGNQSANITSYVSVSYNGRAQFLCDFTNNRIGVLCSSTTGWTYSNYYISVIVGLIKK